MNFEEFFEILSSEDMTNAGKEMSDDILGTICGDPIAFEKLIRKIVKFPISIRDALFFKRLEHFLKGVYLSKEDSISLSDKLFNDEKKRDLNASRVVETIARIDSEEKMKFIINATRCLLCGCMDNTLYFRIIHAIGDTLYEDLLYLSEHVQEGVIDIGNQNVLGLEKSGLMISDGIDGNLDVEYQRFAFTTLGMQVVEYAIDVNNGEKSHLLQELIEKKSILVLEKK